MKTWQTILLAALFLLLAIVTSGASAPLGISLMLGFGSVSIAWSLATMFAPTQFTVYAAVRA